MSESNFYIGASEITDAVHQQGSSVTAELDELNVNLRRLAVIAELALVLYARKTGITPAELSSVAELVGWEMNLGDCRELLGRT